MANRILILDEENIVRSAARTLSYELKTGVEITPVLSEARDLMQINKYGVLIVEPFDIEFFMREKEGPFPLFIRETKTSGIPVIISSTYREDDFQKSFGIRREEYDAYQAKPWDFDEFLESVRTFYRR